MKSEIFWKSKFVFHANIRAHSFDLDVSQALGGKDEGPSPKELVLTAICACAGMDVVGLLRKTETVLTSLKISAEAESRKNHPRIFKEVKLLFEATGNNANTAAFVEAVQKSQNLYCSISAMIAMACPIKYRVFMNGEFIKQGQAAFAEIVE